MILSETEFILPVQLDDTKMERIKEDVAYLDYQIEILHFHLRILKFPECSCHSTS
jgi:hypothetical protein